MTDRAESVSAPFIGSYVFPIGEELSPVELVRVGEIRDGEFHHDADVWAIRWMKRCWTRSGAWEWEPLPSSRGDDFKARTRFCFEDGFRLARHAQAAALRQYTGEIGPVGS